MDDARLEKLPLSEVPDVVVRLRALELLERVRRFTPVPAMFVERLLRLQVRVAAPDDLRRSLDSGKSYLWRVARVDENGAEVDESALTSFTLR